MLGANVLVMFLIDFLEQARVTSKQIAVERNSDLLLLREGCTLKGLDSFFFLNSSTFTDPSSNWDCERVVTQDEIFEQRYSQCLLIYVVCAAIYSAIYCVFTAHCV